MRRLYWAVLVSVGALLLLGGCKKSYDEIQDVGIAEWQPELAVPLVSENVRYSDLFGNKRRDVRCYGAKDDQAIILEYHVNDKVGKTVAGKLFKKPPHRTEIEIPSKAANGNITVGLFDNVPYGVVDAQGVRLVYRLKGLPTGKEQDEVRKYVDFFIGSIAGKVYNYNKDSVKMPDRLRRWKEEKREAGAEVKPFKYWNKPASDTTVKKEDLRYDPDSGYVEFALHGTNSNIVSLFKMGLFEILSERCSFSLTSEFTNLWDPELKEKYGNSPKEFPGLTLQIFLEVPLRDVTVRPLLMVQHIGVKEFFKDLPDSVDHLYREGDLRVELVKESLAKLYIKTLNSVKNATGWCTIEYGSGKDYKQLKFKDAETPQGSGSDEVKEILAGLEMESVIELKGSEAGVPTFRELELQSQQYEALRKADMIRINLLLMTEGNERATFKMTDHVWVHMALSVKPQVSYR